MSGHGGRFVSMGYCDADWGQDPIDRKSISGYIFQINNVAISWSSKKQPTVALSSMEAEYMALTHAAKELLWLKKLIAEINEDSAPNAITIFSDNQSAIAYAHDDQFHARSKHIDIRYHFIREAIQRNDIKLLYVESKENRADIMTKPLARVAFEGQRDAIGLSR